MCLAGLCAAAALRAQPSIEPPPAPAAEPATSRAIDTLAPNVTVHGYLAGYAASGNRALDDVRDIRGLRVGGKLRARAAPATAYLEFDAQALHGARSDDGRRAVREAYVQVEWNTGFVRLGRQIVAWGRADEFNPTDNLTPYQYTRLAFEPAERRIGAGALSVDQALASGLRTQFVVLPAFAASTVPGERALAAQLPSMPALVRSEPAVSWRRPEWGWRLDGSVPGLDVGLSVYRGHSRIGAVALRADGPALTYPATQVLGLDFGATLGNWGVRGELAHTRYLDRSDADAVGLGNNRYLVLGIEKDVGQGSVIVQLLQRDTALPVAARPAGPLADPLAGLRAALVDANRLAAAQVSSSQTALNLSWLATWQGERLETRLAALFGRQRHDSAWRASARYTFADNWSAGLLVEIYRGPADSVLGSQRKNSLALVELRRSF